MDLFETLGNKQRPTLPHNVKPVKDSLIYKVMDEDGKVLGIYYDHNIHDCELKMIEGKPYFVNVYETPAKLERDSFIETAGYEVLFSKLEGNCPARVIVPIRCQNFERDIPHSDSIYCKNHCDKTCPPLSVFDGMMKDEPDDPRLQTPFRDRYGIK